PLWISHQGPDKALLALVDVLNQAGDHGLRPNDYHVRSLEEYLALPRPGQLQLAELDVLATLSMQFYAHDLSSGRHDPGAIDTNWQLDIADHNWQRLLTMQSPSAMVNALPDLAPQHADYRALQRWMVYYQELNERNDDIQIPPGELLMWGSREPRVALLRARLQQLGELRDTGRSPNGSLFDRALEQAVRSFQRRHQLKADGRAGTQTIAAMNVPVAERAEQIRINLERWRWLPAELEEQRLWVDLTAYTLHMHLNGEHHSMRTVIGDTEHPTRVFRGEMTYLEVNPTWRVPQRIARELLLPQVKADRSYLQRNSYEVFSGWHSGAARLNPEDIDWTAIQSDDLAYRFEQLPNPGNAMGKYKFMFPNRNAIYLHDTPVQHHFSQTYRAHSAGCVRVEDPSFFANQLVANSLSGRDQLARARRTSATTVISLDQPLPIYLVYFTAALDAHGLPEFRSDVYERDPLMRAAMR
ncbi:MAG: L,D-transpeptidase family protein, partial [Natronospirillum sp.]